jgi:putative modified peptide
VDERLPLEIAQELTQRLNTDPEFRLEFVRNPRSALLKVGLKLDKREADEIRDSLTISLLEAAVQRGGVAPFGYSRS